MDESRRGAPSRDPQSLARRGPPLGAQVSHGDQSLMLFVRLKFSHQSVSQARPQVVGDSAEAGIRASSHMYNYTDPTHRWRFVMGWQELICD